MFAAYCAQIFHLQKTPAVLRAAIRKRDGDVLFCSVISRFVKNILGN